MEIVHSLLKRFGYKLIRNEKYPNGNLNYFCNGIKQRGFNPINILDVGANKGIWSTAVKEVFPSSKFTLIEPQIEMKPYLDEFCETTKGSTWINCGAGAQEAEMSFSVVKDTVSSSFSVSKEDAEKLGFEQRTIPILTLDKVCKETIKAIPEMIKIDVEGFEYEVIKGAQSLMGKTEIILLELAFFGEHKIALKTHEMFSVMNDMGYRPYDFTSFEHRPYDSALGLCEIAFARENGFLRSYKNWQ